MDIDSIITLIVGSIPAITSIATGIGVMYKIFKSFNDLKKEVKEATELNDIKEQFKIILEQNYKLKEQISQLVEYSKKSPVIKSKTKKEE